MIAPSTPVMNDGPISAGNHVGAGRFSASMASAVKEVACGTSNAIFAIGSWSSISSDGNLLATSLDNIIFLAHANPYGHAHAPLVLVRPAVLNLKLTKRVTREDQLA